MNVIVLNDSTSLF